MKTILILLAATMTFTIAAHAGVTARALRSAIKSSAQHPRPLISETDILQAMRKAQSKARANHLSSEVDIFISKISKAQEFGDKSFFRASIQSQGEFAKSNKKKMTLVLDIRGVDSVTKRKIRSFAANEDWANVGHFDSRIVTLADEGDGLLFKFEISGVNTMDFNNIRGIRKIVDGTFQIALDGNKKSSITPIFSRKAFPKVAEAGVN